MHLILDWKHSSITWAEKYRQPTWNWVNADQRETRHIWEAYKHKTERCAQTISNVFGTTSSPHSSNVSCKETTFSIPRYPIIRSPQLLRRVDFLRVYFKFLSFHFKFLNSSHLYPTFNHFKCNLLSWSFPHSFPFLDMRNYDPFISAPRKLCLVLYYYYLSAVPWSIHPCMTVFPPHIFEIFKP